MKTILWILILSIIFLTAFRFLRKVFAIKNIFKEAIKQQQDTYNQTQNNGRNSYPNDRRSQSFDEPKYNIDAETVDYEIIEENKNEK